MKGVKTWMHTYMWTRTMTPLSLVCSVCFFWSISAYFRFYHCHKNGIANYPGKKKKPIPVSSFLLSELGVGVRPLLLMMKPFYDIFRILVLPCNSSQHIWRMEEQRMMGIKRRNEEKWPINNYIRYIFRYKTPLSTQPSLPQFHIDICRLSE